MKSTAALFLILLLIGCAPNKERQLAACDVEARQTYRDRANDENTSEYIASCMKAKGFDQAFLTVECQTAVKFAQYPLFQAYKESICYTYDWRYFLGF